MVVIYAEKPDVGRKIAHALGGNTCVKKEGYIEMKSGGRDYQVTWGYGHLCGLADPENYNPDFHDWKKRPMPFIPPDYKIVPNEKSAAPIKKAIKVARDLFSKAECIINATDFDREGELIFYYLYKYLGCSKPVMRVNLASTTDEGIQDAFRHLMQSSQFANLLMAAQCRGITDWVVGLNMTVAMTLKNSGGLYSIGRVQTPTLNMVVKRDEEIKNFRPEDYFTVEAQFTTQNEETYKGTHQTKRFPTKEEAEDVCKRCEGMDGVVDSIEVIESKKQVPNLYNLSSLQIDANKKHSINMKRTLDITQKLYEKGLVTYPRTDCQFLPEDMVQKVIQTQQMLKANGYAHLFNSAANESNMFNMKKRFFDDSKIGSHFAIVPTGTVPNNLTDEEKAIYNLIADSVIRMLYPPARFEQTKMKTSVNGELFLTSGNRLLDPGWMYVNGMSSKEELLPTLEIGDVVKSECKVMAKKTEPPKHYTDNTLLSAMITAGKTLEDEELRKFMAGQHNAGIGTEATRAGIVETLLARGYLVRDKKKIMATSVGTSLIHAIPVDEIKSVSLTAQCEQQLNLIEKGELDPGAFLGKVYADVSDWTKRIFASKETVMDQNQTKRNQLDIMCPVCGAPLLQFKWGYGCSEYRNGCKFSIGEICGKMLTQNQVKTLLSKEKIGPISGFKSSKGQPFEGTLVLHPVEEDGKLINYKVWFPKKETMKDEMPDIYATCPRCHARMVKGDYGWECEKKCGFQLRYKICERKLDKLEAEAILSAKSSGLITGFMGKKGPFNAYLVVRDGEVKFEFPERNQ